MCVRVLCVMQITNTTKDAEIEHTVAFPNQLYHQKSNATVSHPQLFT